MFAFFERLLNPFPSEAPEQPPDSLLAFCRHYTKGAGLLLVCMSVAAALIAMMEVALFQFLGVIVDWLGALSTEELWERHGTHLWLMAAMVLVALPLTVLAQSLLIFQSLQGNYPMVIRWQAHRYLLGHSVGFFQDEFAGRIATKVMQTSLAVRETVMKLLNILVYITVYFGSMVFLVGNLDHRLMWPLLLWLAAYIALLRFFLPRLKAIASRQAHARADMTGRIVDTYTNMATVKLFSHSRRESDYARSGMEGFLQTVYPQMRLATLLNVSLWSINALLIFGSGALAIWLWSQNAISAGAIAAAMGLVLRLNGMSQWIMWEVSTLFENIGTAKDGLNTLSRPRRVQDNPGAQPLKVTEGQIEFDRINFRYNDEEQVLKDFSLRLEPGEKIGLVGRSGAGKSTLVNLLLRFYDLQEGCIRIDGQNIAQVQQESLRAQIGMITQDTALLHRSVRDNLLYGKPGATEEEMIEAARQAEAHEFILGLSDAEGRRGYDAHVGERGVKLSGGQRQRIAIARVLLKDAPILIMDEATSALDSEVEAIIQANLSRLMRGKTVIAIAHRLSTIAALDRLVVLDQGRIIEEGSHSQLLDRKGLYAQLWAHQSGGFLGEE